MIPVPRPLFFAAVIVAVRLAAAEPPKTPLYEETFNTPHDRVEFRGGAAMGGPGTGVSGKIGDRAYVATPRSSEQETDGPAALAVSPVAPAPLSAFTCAFWYYLDENGPDLQVPVNTAGFLLLLNERGIELRIEQADTNQRQQTFTPGPNGPLAGWRDTGRWIFAVFTWDQATNTVTVHQGLPGKAVTFMRGMSRPAPAQPSRPRGDLDRNPETLGNTHNRFDRPLAGRLDNVRVFDRVLGRAELEKIRQADIAGVAVDFN